MKNMRVFAFPMAVISVCPLILASLGLCEPEPRVAAHDGGITYAQATHECTHGHRVENRKTTLDSGEVRYTFRYSGCVDPSHGDKRPSAEGNFGMPEPTPANWYWGGFLRLLINGVDAVNYRVEDWKVTESGARGAFQAIFAHPDAEVCIRMMMLPGSRCAMARIQWKPRVGVTIKTVVAELRCYPSFFTAARRRNGERHCVTPRIDTPEPQTLQIDPATDAWLLFKDNVFDVANGEGDGPCAALLDPRTIAGGRVSVGGYAVMTTLDCRPDAGDMRVGLYDFTRWTNAQAESFLKEQGMKDHATLVATDFRPLSVQNLNIDKLRKDANQLLADAGDDAAPFRKQVENLLDKATKLKSESDQGNWRSEAELAAETEASADLFWKLRAFAVLNAPPP